MKAKDSISVLNSYIDYLKNLSGKELDDFIEEADYLNRKFSNKNYPDFELSFITKEEIVISEINVPYKSCISGSYSWENNSLSGGYRLAS